MLMNPFYIGINRHNGKEYPGAQETFISKKMFKAVQRKIHDGKPQTTSKHNPVFKGIIRCEDCNSVVTWQKQKNRQYGVCRRLTPNCKLGNMLREDQIEDRIQCMLKKLTAPSPEIIDWVVEAAKDRYQDDIREQENLIKSIRVQISRIDRMGDVLYEDKLSGEITATRYQQKKQQFKEQKEELIGQLDGVDTSFGSRLDQQLLILELSQKAAEIYANKSADQKRLIISKLFAKLTIKEGVLSVKHSNFTKLITKNVQETTKLMKEPK